MTFMPFFYTVDVYTNTTIYDESGQSQETWTKNRTIKCNFMPSRGEERLVGRVSNPHSYLVWTPDSAIDYPNELRDFKDRYGNSLESGRFNIVGIKRFHGYSKLHHSQVYVQKVLD